MTVKYVDLASGDDTGGDGTYGNPYKTFAKADDGLTGGDEIRVAETTMTTLSGTLTFTNGSASVTTSADQTSAVAAGDVIGKNEIDEGWWLVTSLTSGAITLDHDYWGTTEATTGYAMSPSGTTIQVLATDGSSTSSRLKLSGGWNLGTQTQDGFTFYYPTAGSYALINYSRYSEVAYFVISYDYNFGFAFQSADTYQYYHHCHVAGQADGGGFYFSEDHLIAEDLTHTGLDDDQQYLCSSYDHLYTRCHSYSSGYTGFETSTVTSFTRFVDCVVKGALGANIEGFYLYTSGGTYIENALVDNCNWGMHCYGNAEQIYIDNTTISNCTVGVHSSSMDVPVTLAGCTMSGNTTDFTVTAIHPYSVSRYNVATAAGVFSRLFPYITVSSDTTDARTGTCLKFDPNTALHERMPLIELGVIEVASAASDLTLSVYMKDDASFNGEVILSARQNAKLVAGPVEKTMTTSYVEQTLVIASADLTVGEHLTMYATVTGTAGNVFADDFSYSQ